MSNSIRGTLSNAIARWQSANPTTGKSAVQDRPKPGFDVGGSSFEAHRPPPGRPPFLDAAAEALGLDANNLGERLRAGESLEDIAAAQGVSTEAVLEAIAADFQAKHPEASDDEADAVAQRALEGPPRPRSAPNSQRPEVEGDELLARLKALLKP